jgi:uncharacterized membrane protein
MEKTSTGIQENVASMLCYLVGWVTGLVFFLIEKENKTVRFHAIQSIVVFGFISVLQIVLGMFSFLGIMLMPVIGLAALVLWILLMVKAYQGGEKFKLPVAGDIAEKNA